MRNTLPLLRAPNTQQRSRSRSPSPALTISETPPPPRISNIPSIRLITATPAASGDVSVPSIDSFTYTSPRAAPVPVLKPSPLAPRTDQTPRKTVIPKKSKLGLLSGGSKARERKEKDKENKQREQDLTDIVRRIGGGSGSISRQFDIYVDPMHDSDIGELVVIKKKKSRVALDGLSWGALGEVTNVPHTRNDQPTIITTTVNDGKEQPKEKESEKKNSMMMMMLKASASTDALRVKGEEKDKWWSIRIRRDSKEKTKEKNDSERAATVSAAEARPGRPQRAHSLDGNTLLSRPQLAPLNSAPVMPTVTPPPPVPATISGADLLARSTTPGLLSVPTTDSQANAEKSGSIAIRAMRSMRSIANIAVWSRSDKDGGDVANGEEKEKSSGKEKKKKKEKKEKEKKKATAQSMRSSTSSWEIGHLSPQKGGTVRSNLSRKDSLGPLTALAVPPAEELQLRQRGTVTGATVLKYGDVPTLRQPSANRLSAASSGNTLSTCSGSSGSSILPSRRSSVASKTSKLSSSSSIRWDDNVDLHKEQRRRERAEKGSSAGSVATMETKRSSVEARKRGALSSIFPAGPPQIPENPMVTIEAATLDGHGVVEEDFTADYTIEARTDYTVDSRTTSLNQTPKKNRPRPASEQLLKSRPEPFTDDEGVISKLREVNDDLASLINRLDLQATPSSTPNGTPSQNLYQSTRSTFDELRRSVTDSPTKGGNLLKSSVSSLRPYVQSRPQSQPSDPPFIGQQIAPWPSLTSLKVIEERLPPPPKVVESDEKPKPAFRPKHKRSLSLAPENEPAPVFQPLQPAKARSALSPISTVRPETIMTPPMSATLPGAPGSSTFGASKPKKSMGFGSSDEQGSPTPGPVFQNPSRHSRAGSSTSSISIPMRWSKLSSSPISLPVAEESGHKLGLGGTMGSTISSIVLDPEDPDSDIPDELQAILSHNDCPPSPSEDTMSLPTPIVEEMDIGPSPGLPPCQPLPEPEEEETRSVPIFRAQLVDDRGDEADIEECGGMSSEDNTTKSFDFTGELRMLNESGASDRLSFVEQVEKAFATPAPIRLDEFERKDGRLSAELPPLPPLPLSTKPSRSSFSSIHSTAPSPQLSVNLSLPSSDEVPKLTAEVSSPEIGRRRRSHSSSLGSSLGLSRASRPSNGELNTNFKFGGCLSSKEPTPQKKESTEKLTLSDIIPPLGHASRPSLVSLAEVDEDNSVLGSIYGHAISPPAPARRPRVESITGLKRLSRISQASEASFVGFDSFADVRRGFEFSTERPAFYPLPSTRATRRHIPHDSMFSIASVSSYGNVLDSGTEDPFEYGHHSRAPSEDMSSMSHDASINDTFSFIYRARGQPLNDKSSFCFKAPYPMIGGQRRHQRTGSRMSAMSRPGHAREDSFSFQRGNHRRDESFMSVASGPPISLYNRSFGHHRRNDSNASIRGLRSQDSSTSASSLAHAYTMLGANAGRAAWAKHRHDGSTDTVASDLSMMRLGRPGLGDKMLDSSMPLEPISASPPESVSGENMLGNRTSFDSILDGDRRSFVSDSLFEYTADRTSVSSASIFGWDPHMPQQTQRQLFAPTYFRPISMSSLDSAHAHSPAKEDDTMITMFGGARIRRKSLGSSVAASPCVRVEKRKHVEFEEEPEENVEMSYDDSFEKAQIMHAHVVRPSLASASSHIFGEERMGLAQRGLLARQSLEDSCLVAEGEEDLSVSTRSASFARPTRARPRSNTSTTTTSSGSATPPLSPSTGSSISGGSQSSIDLSSLSEILVNASHPSTNLGQARPRTRARGHGHRRRISALQSRSSVYETIHEEVPSPTEPIGPPPTSFQMDFARYNDDSVMVVDHEHDTAEWDDERGIVELRRYYALRDEADVTVSESRRAWMDTPFSLFALQTFHPPDSPHAMRALLEHSQKTYMPLPEELRLLRRRSRRDSTSPYPRSTVSNMSLSSHHTQSGDFSHYSQSSNHTQPRALQQISINPNIMSPPPTLDAVKPMSPFAMFGPPPTKQKEPIPRPIARVPSTTRRNALGWSKRVVPKSEENKENKENTPNRTVLMSPNESLRLSRPRPRGRPTPARQSARV